MLGENSFTQGRYNGKSAVRAGSRTSGTVSRRSGTPLPSRGLMWRRVFKNKVVTTIKVAEPGNRRSERGSWTRPTYSPDKDKHINLKLAPRYEGPYVVTALPSPEIATLENPETRETRQAHKDDLEHYTPREETPSDKPPTIRRPRGRPRRASEGTSAELPTSSPRARP
jgi:hypothetical protein